MAKADYWRCVPGYPDIEISDELVVRSKARTTEYDHSLWGRQTRCFPSKVLTTQKQHKDGYLTVFVNSVRRPVGLHVIVCPAFHGASPAGKPYALHRDGNPANCAMASAKGQLYMHVHDEKVKLPLTKLYEQMVKQGSTLILVNMPGVVEPMFDAGEVPVPSKLMMRFMKAVVDSDKAAESCCAAWAAAPSRKRPSSPG